MTQVKHVDLSCYKGFKYVSEIGSSSIEKTTTLITRNYPSPTIAVSSTIFQRKKRIEEENDEFDIFRSSANTLKNSIMVILISVGINFA